MAVDIGTAVNSIVQSAINPDGKKQDTIVEVADEATKQPFVPPVETPVTEAAEEYLEPVTTDVNPDEDDKPVQVAGVAKIVKKVGEDIKAGAKTYVEGVEKRVGAVSPDPDNFFTRYGDPSVSFPDATEEELTNLTKLFAEKSKDGKIEDIAYPGGKVAEKHRDFVNSLKENYSSIFNKAKRGTINFDDMIKKAKNKNINETIKYWLDPKKFKSAKAEDIVGGAMASLKLFNETTAIWKKIENATSDEEIVSLTKRAKAMSFLFFDVTTNLTGQKAEAGRSLYAARMIGQSPDMRKLEEASEEMQRRLFNSDLSDPNTARAVAHVLGTLDTIEEKITFIQRGKAAKTLDALAEIWVNSLLSGPSTHVINLAGTTSFAVIRQLESFVASGIGFARQKIVAGLGGAPNPERIRFNETIAGWDATGKMLADAMVIFAKTFKRGTELYGGGKIDVRTRQAIGNIVDLGDLFGKNPELKRSPAAVFLDVYGVLTGMPGRFLSAEDAFMKSLAYQRHIRVEATKEGNKIYDASIAAGKTKEEPLEASRVARQEIVDRPPASVDLAAKNVAKSLTFQTGLTGRMGQFAASLNHPIIKFVIPFVRTPVNIFKAFTDRMPIVNFFSKETRDDWAAGGARRDLLFARMTVSGGALLAYTSFVSNNMKEGGKYVITGNGPTERKERLAWLERFQPYSICKLGNDGSYTCTTYSRMDPISGFLAVAADFAHLSSKMTSSKDVGILAMSAADSIGKYVMTHPFAQGLAELTDAAKSQKGTEAFFEVLIKKAVEAGASAIPGVGGLGRSVDRMLSKNLKATGVPVQGLFGGDAATSNFVARSFYTAVNNLASKYPFIKGRPEKLNRWAETIKTGYGDIRDIYSIFKVQNSKYRAVTEEERRLNISMGDFERTIAGVPINVNLERTWKIATNSMDRNGQMPYLPNGKPNKDYLPNTTLLDTLKAAIATKEYLNLPDTERGRQEAIRKAYKEEYNREPTRMELARAVEDSPLKTKGEYLKYIFRRYKSVAKQYMFDDKENNGDKLYQAIKLTEELR